MAEDQVNISLFYRSGTASRSNSDSIGRLAAVLAKLAAQIEALPVHNAVAARMQLSIAVMQAHLATKQ